MKQGSILIVLLTVAYTVGQLAGAMALITFLAVLYSGVWLTDRIFGPISHTRKGELFDDPHMLPYTTTIVIAIILANTVHYLISR